MNDPKIRLDFWLTGDVYDPEEISEVLQLKPTKTKLKKDCKLPQTAVTFWKISTEKEESKAVSNQFDKLVGLLKPKVGKINELCEKLSLTASFVAIVEMEAENRPDFSITQDHISLMAALQADFSIDLYIYEDLDTAFS